MCCYLPLDDCSLELKRELRRAREAVERYQDTLRLILQDATVCESVRPDAHAACPELFAEHRSMWCVHCLARGVLE